MANKYSLFFPNSMEKGDVRYLGLLPFHFIGTIFIDKISIHRKKVLAIYTLAQK